MNRLGRVSVFTLSRLPSVNHLLALEMRILMGKIAVVSLRFSLYRQWGE